MKKEALTEVVKVRLSPREYKELAEASDREQRTISDFIRLSLRKATLLSLAGNASRRKELR